MTEDQIEELRDLQKELRAQAEAIDDAWHTWVGGWEDVSMAIHRYNELLKQARDITGDPTGELGDLDPDFDPQELGLNEADAIDGIIEDDAAEQTSS